MDRLARQIASTRSREITHRRSDVLRAAAATEQRGASVAMLRLRPVEVGIDAKSGC
jgi:hypothetical protein